MIVFYLEFVEVVAWVRMVSWLTWDYFRFFGAGAALDFRLDEVGAALDFLRDEAGAALDFLRLDAAGAAFLRRLLVAGLDRRLFPAAEDLDRRRLLVAGFRLAAPSLLAASLSFHAASRR